MNINEITAGLAEQIKLAKQKLIQLEQALALINGGSPTVAPTLKEQVQEMQAAAKKGRKNKKTPKTRKVGHAFAWKPAKNAAPWVQHVYTLLADGQPKLPDEVHAYVTAQGVNVPRGKVVNVLIWMKQSGRLMLENKKYRRKYFRKPDTAEVVVTPSTAELLNQKPETYLSVEHLPEDQRTEAVARLDALVEEGKLHKTMRAGQAIYVPATVAPKTE